MAKASRKPKASTSTSPKVPKDRVTAFAKEVVSGKLIAGPHVRAQCDRHLRDLVEGKKRGLKWDLDKANHAIEFFEEVLKLNGGEFEGEPFLLLGWQAFIIGSLYGWLGSDGYRRFRVAYVETAKGSGKSPLAAGVGMKGLVADGELRAEVYSAATKKDQAMILFRDAVAMNEQSPALSERLIPSGRGERCWNLAYLDNGSFFRPISSDDGQSGPRPHVALIDEIHEHKTGTVVEVMRAGTKSRRQALIFMITNSGSNKNGPCWAYHQYGIAIARGDQEDDSFFPFICALDEGDDPFQDEACWAKANPSLMDKHPSMKKAANLPGLKYIREQVREAIGMPSKEAIVRRLNFCQWTEAESPWLSAEVWKGAQREYTLESLKGRKAYGGLDLSSTTDLTAMVFIVEPVEPQEPWKIVAFPYLPDDGLERKSEVDRVPYSMWKKQGFLHTTPGRAISKKIILQKLISMCGFFDVQGVAYDRWRMEELLALASDEGIVLPEMVEFGQGYKDMSPAVEIFERMLLNGELVHNGHPVMTMCAMNTVTDSDGAGNRKPDKENANGRIDLLVAGLMAVGTISKPKKEPPPTYQMFFVGRPQ